MHPPPPGTLFNPAPETIVKTPGSPPKTPACLTPGKCRSCGAPILWGKSEKSGANVPMDPNPSILVLVDTERGTVAQRSGFINHFITCPSAQQHRKAK